MVSRRNMSSEGGDRVEVDSVRRRREQRPERFRGTGAAVDVVRRA